MVDRIALDDIKPIAIARGPKDRCGRCDGLIASEKLNNGLIYVCRNCGREATPNDCGVVETQVLLGQLSFWTP